MAAIEASHEVPPSLSAKVVGSCAYLTVKDRLPTILTKVIDTIHRNKDKFLEEYGKEGIEAEKQTISLLSKLRNEMQTDKPVVPLTDGLPDAEIWNQYLQRHRQLEDHQEAVSWFKSPWLYVECYMYRRIQEALWLNPPISGYDVFNEGKTMSFLESQQAVMTLCTYLEDLKKKTEGLSKKELFVYFKKLLQVSLWGNKCDLSISAGKDNSQKTDVVDSLSSMQPFILVDDSDAIWSTFTSAKSQRPPDNSAGCRLDIVLDNASFELITDLVLADFLVYTGIVREVRFHGKSFPWFVSDVTVNDFHWTIKQTMATNHRWVSKSGVKWQSYLKEGVWSYHDHPFWTLPHEYCEMAATAPDLYATLQESDLILLKGDLNYRKLMGDRYWDHAVSFGTSLRGFGPAPLFTLRTLKSNTLVGLQPGQAEQLSSEEPDWMSSSKYATIQFYNPKAEQQE